MATTLVSALRLMQSLGDCGMSKLKNTCGGEASIRQRGLLWFPKVDCIVAYGNCDVNWFFVAQKLLSLEKILKKWVNEFAHKGLRKFLLCGSLVSSSICGIKITKKQHFL